MYLYYHKKPSRQLSPPRDDIKKLFHYMVIIEQLPTFMSSQIYIYFLYVTIFFFFVANATFASIFRNSYHMFRNLFKPPVASANTFQDCSSVADVTPLPPRPPEICYVKSCSYFFIIPAIFKLLSDYHVQNR
jgi:hypothetical protein